MKFLIFALAYAAVTLAYAEQRKNAAAPARQQVYKIPEPDNGDGAMIVEFANAIDGTDGTPESIGQKAQKAQENPKTKLNRSGASSGPRVVPVKIGQ